MSPTGQPKVCASCGADVSNAERLKDAQGRYICMPCADRLRAKKRAGGGPAAGAVGGGARAVGSSDQGADLREFMAQAQQAARSQCPSCGAFAPPDAVICLSCGYDSRTQGQLRTKFGKAKRGGGGGGLGIALPEGGTIVGVMVFLYFLFAVALPVLDIFVLKMGLIAISFGIVFLMSFALWIFAIIGFMRRASSPVVSVLVVLLSLFVWPISALIAMVYGAFFAESRMLKWMSISNILGFVTCIGLIAYSLVTDTPMVSP